MDLDRCLFSGQVFRWQRLSDEEYRGVDGANWYRLRRSGNELQVETNGSHSDFYALFNLTVDARDIEQRILSAAPEMEACMKGLRGLRMMRPSDPVEVFFTFLCTANNNLKRIVPMVAKLANYGDAMDLADFHRFPGTRAIAEIPETDLRRLGFGYRAATIPRVAIEVIKGGGDTWIANLATVGYLQAHKELVSIPSIGNKLADCICLYGLHYDEAVPIDTHLWQAACKVFFPEHLGKSLTELRYRQVGNYFRDRFGKLAGWAHLYLYYGNMLRNTLEV